MSILTSRVVLVISPQPWKHIHVSKHHYAIELLKKKNRVFFLNPPGEPYGVRSTNYKNLFELNYPGFLKGLRFFPKVIRRWEQRRVFSKLKKFTKTKFDLIWSFDNSVFYDMDVFGNEVIKVSHIVDLGQNFQLKSSARSADLCFGVIPDIVNKQRKYNNKSYLIHHGVQESDCHVQIMLPGSNKFKALYFGNLAMPNLDWGLMEQSLKRFPFIDFIFIGPNTTDIKGEVKDSPNTHFLPAVESSTLICYMQEADILMLFYNKEYKVSYAFPHKLMEYLYSGKPILSTFTPFDKDFTDLIATVDSQEEWLEKLQNIIMEYGFYSSEELTGKRKSLAKKNTYKKQLERIDNLIASLI